MTTPRELIARYATQSQLSSFFIDRMGIYNVKSYDAEGDGTTNDHTALYDANNDADSNGGIIFFPTGTYKVSSNLTFSSNVTLWFADGAKLSPDSGITITISGNIVAGLYQIFTGSGTIAGTPKIDKVYLQWFGSVGDGITDDTTSLQSAIDYCSQNSLELYLTKGTYLFSNTVNLTNVKITGDNVDNTTIKASVNITNGVYLDGNVSIKDIYIDGDNKVSQCIKSDVATNEVIFENVKCSNASAYGAYINAKSLQTIKCDFSDNTGEGLRFNAPNSGANFSFKDTKFNNNGICGLVNRDRANGANFDSVRVEGCTATGNTNSGIATHSANHITLIENHSYNNGEHGITLMDGKDATVTGNICFGNAAAGLRIQGDTSYIPGDSLTGWDKAIVACNDFSGNGTGISMEHGIRNVVMANNGLKEETNYTIYIYDTATETDCENITGIGNILGSSASYPHPTVVKGKKSYYFDNYDQSGNRILGYRYINDKPSYTSKEILYGDRTNVIQSPTDFTNTTYWKWDGTISSGVLTSNGSSSYGYQRLNYAKQRYLSMVFLVDTALSNETSFVMQFRFRGSTSNLLADASVTLKILDDVTKLSIDFADFSNITQSVKDNAVYLDVWLRGSSSPGSTIKPLGLYGCFSNELPILPITF